MNLSNEQLRNNFIDDMKLMCLCNSCSMQDEYSCDDFLNGREAWTKRPIPSNIHKFLESINYSIPADNMMNFMTIVIIIYDYIYTNKLYKKNKLYKPDSSEESEFDKTKMVPDKNLCSLFFEEDYEESYSIDIIMPTICCWHNSCSIKDHYHIADVFDWDKNTSYVKKPISSKIHNFLESINYTIPDDNMMDYNTITEIIRDYIKKNKLYKSDSAEETDFDITEMIPDKNLCSLFFEEEDKFYSINDTIASICWYI